MSRVRFPLPREDSGPVAVYLARLHVLAVELTAALEVWRCPVCGDITAHLSWPDP